MKRILLIASLAFLLVVPFLAHAAIATPSHSYIRLPDCATSVPPAPVGKCGFEDFLELFINLYHFGLEITGPLAILYFIIGGVIMLTAGGYETRYKLGRDMLSQVVAGLLIVLLSWVIVDTTMFLLTGNRDRTVFGKPWYNGFTYQCTTDLRYGCGGADVRTVQQQLIRLGYTLRGGADGDFGRSTEDALTQFQTDINALYVANPTEACDNTDAARLLWEDAFGIEHGQGALCESQSYLYDFCPTLGNAEAKLLTVNGIADAKTQEALSFAASRSGYFHDACATL